MNFLKKTSLAVASALALAAGLTGAPNRAEAGTQPYLGDIMIVGFNFCPRGWAAAQGQLLSINQYQALYSLLGTDFGGDGQTTFGLPDLRGRMTVGRGQGLGLADHPIGQKFGTERATMTTAEMPPHNHMVNANNLDGDKAGPGGKLLAAAPTGGTGNETIYSEANPNVKMNPTMIDNNSGGSLPFSTQDPTLGLTHCIALQGLFPPRN